MTKKLEHLLHKKNQLLKIIEKDLSSRRERARKIITILLVFLKVNGKGSAMQWEIVRDHLAANSKMADFGPFGAKIAFSASPLWHYVYSGFSQNRPILKNPFLGKMQARHRKTQKFRGRDPRNKFWPFFQDPHFEVSGGNFQIANLKTPIFPAILGIFALH